MSAAPPSPRAPPGPPPSQPPQRQHRKSQSTSALAVTAASGSGVQQRKPHSRRPARLELGGDADSQHDFQTTGVGAWMSEAISTRCSSSRSLANLLRVERAFSQACGVSAQDAVDLTGIQQLLGLGLHTKLLLLLSRHAQTLAGRTNAHTAVAPQDNTAIALLPELAIIMELLQGLCLLSTAAQTACAEDWVVEILIDLLLALRAIPRLPTDPSGRPERPIALLILDLLSSILVDAPAHTRTFERLGGLEAATRVLRGTGVDKEVRVRCLEFLYFYLMPETAPGSGYDSSRSGSGSGTTNSTLSDDPYPPSPLSAASDILHDSLAPPPRIVTATDPGGETETEDSVAAFVPRTPRKKPAATLGFMTPSTNAMRRSSGSGSGASSRSTTPTPSPAPMLETVPASPDVMGRVSTPRSAAGAAGGSRGAGLGLGLPRSATMDFDGRPASGSHTDSESTPRRLDGRRLSATPSRAAAVPPSPRSRPSAASRSSLHPSAAHTPPLPPLPPTPSRASQDAPRRSSTYSSLAQAAGGSSAASSASSSAPTRSRTPTTPTTTSFARPDAPAMAQRVPATTATGGVAPRVRRSMAPSHSYSSLAAHAEGVGKSGSRIGQTTASTSTSTPPVPPLPAPKRSGSGSDRTMPPPASPAPGPPRTPSRLRRDESERERGSSRMDIAGLLGTPSRSERTRSREGVSAGPVSFGRDVSRDRASSRVGMGAASKGGGGGAVRSVEEKKALLSSWIGNVDELVESIQKVNRAGRGVGASTSSKPSKA